MDLLRYLFSFNEVRSNQSEESTQEALQIVNQPFDRKFSDDLECSICFTSGTFNHCFRCGRCYHMKCFCQPLPQDNGNAIEVSHVHQHPLVFVGNGDEFSCAACRNATELGDDDAFYACLDCQLYLHKKCLDHLPPEINHPLHREHHLVPEFQGEPGLWLCNLCNSYLEGVFYRCSDCDIAIHSYCCSDELPPTIEDNSYHEHPFTLFLRPQKFDCDACGNEGNNVSYICSACNLQVHKNCISLPRFITINLHLHPLSRMFFLRDYQHGWDCRICYKKVNRRHGCYHCPKPDCSFITHVTCAINNGAFYNLIELDGLDDVDDGSNEFSDESVRSIVRVISEIKVGDDIIAVEIIHFSHEQHSLTIVDQSYDFCREQQTLTLIDQINGVKLCDGCTLPIESPFYYCSHCDFFLHKRCAELPKMKRLWFCVRPVTLVTEDIFKCNNCEQIGSGFFYNADNRTSFCLRCAALAHGLPYKAREEHFLFFDQNFVGQCKACGSCRNVNYRCKDSSSFALDWSCLTLPRTVRHKGDKHLLKLTCGDDNDYALHHFCDICEEERDPELWFYRCEVCNTTVHPKCALGDYPFIKRGITFECKDHSHPLTSVQKIYYYPLCIKCNKPCLDLALECEEPGCNYIAHWDCI